MRTKLDDRQCQELDRRVAEAEKRTGSQIVLAVAGRCDAYPELPWKAFALGSVAMGLGACLRAVIRPSWTPDRDVLPALVATLGFGAACALLCVVFPGFARLFLDRHRAEAEALQYAQSLFLARHLESTKRRSAVLLLVGLFERHVVVLPDAGVATRLETGATAAIASAMTAAMKSSGTAAALEAGLTCLEQHLVPSPGTAPEGDELPNDVIEEDRP